MGVSEYANTLKVRGLSSDPRVSPGVAAAVGTVGRTSDGALFYKFGALDMEWRAEAPVSWHDRMSQLAHARLGGTLVDLRGHFLGVRATNPHYHDLTAVSGTGRASLTEVVGAIRLGSGAGVGLGLLDSYGTAPGGIIPNQQSSKYFLGARIRTPTPGTFDADTVVSIGFFPGAGATVNWGLAIHGGVSASIWRIWRANSGAWTLAASTAGTKTATDTQDWTDVFIYADGTRIAASVGGSEWVAGFAPSTLTNERGEWRFISNRVGGSDDDVLDVGAYYFARVLA